MRPEDEYGWREFRDVEKSYKHCISPFTKYELCIPDPHPDGVCCKYCGRPMTLKTIAKGTTDD